MTQQPHNQREKGITTELNKSGIKNPNAADKLHIMPQSSETRGTKLNCKSN